AMSLTPCKSGCECTALLIAAYRAFRNIHALQSLGSARQALVLRHWLKSAHQTTPSTVQLAELMSQISSCTTRGHQLHLKVGRGFVRRDQGVLVWTAED
ncbi:MAG: TilS substrate-binding domain-containing protein, partial [Limnohabitans sp.]